MSGSIHETRRSVREQHNVEYSGAEAHEEAIWFAREQLWRKRRIKQAVRETRSSEALLEAAVELPGQAAADVPIAVYGEREHYIHPLGVDDIRALLRLLPVGVLDGLGGIELRPGVGPFDADSDYPGPDPISGRRGSELLPGMWWQQILGTHFRKNLIHIYAVVTDLHAVPFVAEERQVARLITAQTVLHEVAHHRDSTRRVARGRWRMDEMWKNEAFAESQAMDWLTTIVAPFLESRFPDDQAHLTAWLATRCQAVVSLAQIGQDMDAQLGGYFHATAHSFGDAQEGKDDTAIAVEFANQLHYNEHYSDALSVLRRVVAGDPDNLEALALEGDIAGHERRHDDAERLARHVLARDPAHEGALEVLLDIYVTTRRWQSVVETALKLQGSASGWLAASARARLARAYLEVGDVEMFDGQIAILESSTYRAGKSNAVVLRAMRALRDGDPEHALQIVGPPAKSQRPLSRLIRWEAAHRVGRPKEGGSLSDFHLEVLRNAEPEWVARVEVECGPIPTVTHVSHRQARLSRAVDRRM